MNYWKFNRAMLFRLRMWNIINLIVGAKLSRNENKLVKGIGTQAAGWAFINLCIVAFGLVTTHRKKQSLEDPLDPELMQKEAKSLYRLLWINNRLNLVYMASGLWLALVKGKNSATMRGNGVGVMIQGLLLFMHDSTFASKLKALRDQNAKS